MNFKQFFATMIWTIGMFFLTLTINILPSESLDSCFAGIIFGVLTMITFNAIFYRIKEER